jgi:hypothetical protein
MLFTTLQQVHPDTNGVHKKQSHDATTLAGGAGLYG